MTWMSGSTDSRRAFATRSLQGVHAILKRAIRQAQARNKVLRNVAELVTTPKGKPGRPSRAITLEQAAAMLKQAEASRLHAVAPRLAPPNPRKIRKGSRRDLRNPFRTAETCGRGGRI